ncbi:glycosyltransferase [Candidatus Parcubacteria bacterium]|nr:MAG: glycosyltransferase [Candidatus Parcubacteria bacterium]
MRSTPKTILIAGYYGFKNTGDEAILATMILDLRALLPEVHIIVVSGDPQDTEKSHGVSAVSWNEMQRIIIAMTMCDLVIMGGGGLFHDYWGLDPTTVFTPHHSGIAFYSSIALLASILDKPLMLYAVGVGPLFSEMGKFYTRAIVEQACLVSVRDEESLEQLQSLGIPSEQIQVTADPAFGLQPAVMDSEILGAGIQDGPILGIALRNWDVGVLPDYWEGQVAGAIDAFLDLHKGSATFIPFQDQGEILLDDFGISERIQHRLRNVERTCILQGIYSPAEKAGMMAQCDLILGMRLHALIFSISNGIPVVGMAYDPKVRNVMTKAGIEKYAINLEEVTSYSLAILLEQAYKNRDRLTNQIHTVRRNLEKKARSNAELAVGVLEQFPRVQKTLTPATTQVLKQVALSLSQTIVTDLRQINNLTRQGEDLQLALETQAREHQIISKDLKAELEDRTKEHKRVIAHLQEEMSRQIDHRDRVIGDLKASLETQESSHKHAIQKFEMHVGEITREKKDLDTQIANKERSIKLLDSQLSEIKGSRAWKVIWALWQIRLFIIPNGSWRERILRRIWRGLRKNPFEFARKVSRRILIRHKLQMSRYSFAFDVFKRFRNSMYPPDLSSLRTPSQKGLVSIVLPVYNGAVLVSEAIDSVLDQSYKYFELIMINDGSQDSTSEILDEYARKDQRIRVVHQENKKLPRALSRGFQMARGEFLTWTSHDNRLKVDFLEKMVACLQRHPCWDMIYANLDIIGEDGSPLRDSNWYAGYQQFPGNEHIHLPEDTSELNTYPNNFIGGAFLYRDRVAWLTGDYSPVQYTREDYDYWMRVNSLLILRHVDFKETVYEYRFLPNSLTDRDAELGITRDRKNLMVFDDFRRDFFLTPLVWLMDEDISVNNARDEIRSLRSLISKLGHISDKYHQFESSSMPHLWVPYVYLKVTADLDPSLSPPKELPPGTTRVLLCLSQEKLPDTIDAEWDFCLSCGSEVPPPKLEKDRQGWLVSTDMQTLLTAIDIRARSRHIELIELEIVQGEPAKYKVSVIICTYKRGQGLVDALRSVANQSLSQKDYEVVVVNNDPDDLMVAPLIEKIRAEGFSNHPDHLRLLICPILGLSHARNAGISDAKGEILLFLDDDGIAGHEVLEHYWRAFSEHTDAGVIGGHIVVNPPHQKRIPWKDGFERYWSQFVTGYSDYAIVNNWWEFPWGANWCARRQALISVGGFRGQFGRRGSDFNGGEEIVAAALIQKLGYTIAILPQAEVVHKVESNRFTLRHLKQTIWAGLFTQYKAQVELHLPVETSLGGSLRYISNSLFKLSFIFHPKYPSRKADLLEAYFHISARCWLLCRQIVDGFLRLRRPITLRKKCP